MFIIRLYSAKRSGAFVSGLLSNPIFKDVVKSNVDNDTSFNALDITIEKTLSEPNAALYYYKDFINSLLRKYDCKNQVL